MQRKGKIARLPLPLRTQINLRLAAHQDGAALLEWLAQQEMLEEARDLAAETSTAAANAETFPTGSARPSAPVTATQNGAAQNHNPAVARPRVT
jgi:hypothetical protein